MNMESFNQISILENLTAPKTEFKMLVLKDLPEATEHWVTNKSMVITIIVNSIKSFVYQ